MSYNRQQRGPSEQGASATMFVIALSALLGVALVAIDGGSLFVSQRGQVPDTDAAALAVAILLADDPCASQSEVEAEAADIIAANDPDTSLVSVDVDLDTSCRPGGTVAVETTRAANLFFAPFFGTDNVDTSVSSKAKLGPIAQATGLKPIGMCRLDPHFVTEWEPYLQAERSGSSFDMSAAEVAADAQYAAAFPEVDAHPDVDSDGVSYGSNQVHRMVFFDPDAGSFCGTEVEGNFGWLDFDGDGAVDTFGYDCPDGVSPNSELNCEVATGHQGPISISPPDCAPDDPGRSRCFSQTGEVSAASSGLGRIECGPTAPASTCEIAYIIVYTDDVEPGCPGNSCPQFEIHSVVGIVIRDFVANGPPKDHYIDLEFVDQLYSGVIGAYDPDSTAPLGVTLCGANAFDNC